MMGIAWDKSDDRAREATMAAGDNKIVTASAEDQAKFAEMAARVRTKVLAEISALGIDADAAAEMAASTMASYGK